MKRKNDYTLNKLLLIGIFATSFVALLFIGGLSAQNVLMKEAGTSYAEIESNLAKYPHFVLTEHNDSCIAAAGGSIAVSYRFENGQLVAANIVKQYDNRKLAKIGLYANLEWLEGRRALVSKATDEKFEEEYFAWNESLEYKLHMQAQEKGKWMLEYSMRPFVPNMAGFVGPEISMNTIR